MPRDRVVLTREDSASNQQAESNRAFRRGFTFIGVGALLDVVAVVLIFFEQIAAGAAAAVVGILIGMLSIREFNRVGRAGESQRY